jgi:hypothetical protein
MGDRKKAKSGGEKQGVRGRYRRPRTPPTFNTLLADGGAPDRPAYMITQRELEEYQAELDEIRTLLARHARRREGLAVRVWDGAVVEEGPLTVGLMPTGGPGVKFGTAAHAIESGTIDSYDRKPGGKRVVLVVGTRESKEPAIRDHGVSEDFPKGRLPRPLLALLLSPS